MVYLFLIFISVLLAFTAKRLEDVQDTVEELRDQLKFVPNPNATWQSN